MFAGKHITEQIRADLAQTGPELEARLRILVDIESPTESIRGVNQAVQQVERWAAEIGGISRRHHQTDFGHVLELGFGLGVSSRPPLLLLGHLDTVWPLGTLRHMPWHEHNDRLYGPGILDMKAGIIMALEALQCLRRLGLDRPVRLLVNSDEEMGSPVSRPITERLARESAAVFVLEPAQGLAYKTARKGVGEYLLEVTGVAAHSGVDFERGHSAALELAKLVQTVSTFTDLGRGLTVNCGVLSAGTRPNVVPEHARAQIDIRIARAEDGPHIDKLFRTLKVSDPGCQLAISGGLNRPPMERTERTVALFQKAQALAAELGFRLAEASTGGGSDGNFTAALDVPTLDGMGAVGEGAHAAHECILREHLVPRTALLAAMIATI